MGKACITCERRRIWCDATTPHCHICTNSGRSCDGYKESHQVFVNFDSNNIQAPKKRVRGQAIRKAQATKQAPTTNIISITSYNYDASALFLNGHNYREFSIWSLDVSAGEFREHFTTLWGVFHNTYASTFDSFTHGLSHFTLQNKALDLGLIALSTTRLAVHADDPNLQVMAHTAYHHSLRLFRFVLEAKKQGWFAFYFITSFTLALVEGARQRPTTIYQSESGRHLAAALSFMAQQGPELFAMDGYHGVFRKCREMAIHHAVAWRNQIFMARKEWMTVPWKDKKKTWRDKLHDVGIQIPEVVAYVHKMDDPTEPSTESGKSPEDMLKRCQTLANNLRVWRSTWQQSAYPHLMVTCNGLCPTVCHCSIPPAEFPCPDFAHLQAEYWSEYLLLGMLSKELESKLQIENTTPLFTTKEIQRLYNLVDDALNHPYFGQVHEDTPGITEGRCRSLFPIWVLNQYRASGYDKRLPDPKVNSLWWGNLGKWATVGEQRAYVSPYARVGQVKRQIQAA